MESQHCLAPIINVWPQSWPLIGGERWYILPTYFHQVISIFTSQILIPFKIAPTGATYVSDYSVYHRGQLIILMWNSCLCRLSKRWTRCNGSTSCRSSSRSSRESWVWRWGVSTWCGVIVAKPQWTMKARDARLESEQECQSLWQAVVTHDSLLWLFKWGSIYGKGSCTVDGITYIQSTYSVTVQFCVCACVCVFACVCGCVWVWVYTCVDKVGMRGWWRV